MTEIKDADKTVKPKKAAAKPKAATKATTVKKTTTTAKKPTTAKKSKSVAASPEHHYRMVEIAAYYLAEKDGFSGNPVDYWIAAELQIKSQ